MLTSAVLNARFVDTCSYARATGVDASGGQTRAAAVNFKGRVVNRDRRTRNSKGEEVTSLTQIQTLTPVELSDLVTLPDASIHEVLAVSSAKSLTSHLVMYEVML